MMMVPHDSDAVRVGELVIIIGFPIASELGAEPTVSQRDRLRQAQWPDSDRRARESWQ